jgi:acyl-CoA thioester hydrolase
MLMDIGKFNKYKIYITYQDVDVAGVVYFANYFNYAEKARSLFIKEIFGSILFSKDHNWAVKSTQMEYLKPAKLQDNLIVETNIVDLKLASFVFEQKFSVDDNLIGIMKTHLLSIDSNLKPIRIPNEKVEILKKVSII